MNEKQPHAIMDYGPGRVRVLGLPGGLQAAVFATLLPKEFEHLGPLVCTVQADHRAPVCLYDERTTSLQKTCAPGPHGTMIWPWPHAPSIVYSAAVILIAGEQE